MKKLISIMLVLCMVLPMVPANVFAATIVASGTCGENLTWTLDSDGLLTISGSGEMTDYFYDNAPWHGFFLEKVVIQDGVTSISDCAFRWCESLTSITIPDSVTSIGACAFASCESLTSITIPDSVTSIGNCAFDYCDNLMSFNVYDNAYYLGNNQNPYLVLVSATTESIASCTIHSETKIVCYEAFEYCRSLTSITIPDSVAIIGECAFMWCESLTSITIPDSVTSIGDSAFECCTSLTSITIPGSVTEIGVAAFDGCPSLADVYYGASKEKWDSLEIDRYNEDLLNARIHFNSNDPSNTGGNGHIRLFTSWDPVQQIAYLGEFDFLGCKVTEKTDTSFLANVENLVGKYVWVESEPVGNGIVDSDILLCIKEVETRTGTVSQADASTITIDGVVYTTPNDMDLPGIFAGEQVRYYLSNGELLGLELFDGSLPENPSTPGDDNRPEQPGDNSGENDSTAGKLMVYSDYTNLSISTGSIITLSAGIQFNGELSADVSNVIFQVADTSILKVIDTETSGNCRYVKLKGLQKGTTTVAFTDSKTGKTITIPVTVCDNYYYSYTLSNIPTQYIEKYPTNFYNVNGLYVDSYQYSVNDDGSATVSFDIYNTNYTYGTVEVFDKNGNLDSVVLIDKMASSNTGIKEAVWDNVGYLIRDFFDGDFLTYRQESGYSVRTPVHVTIPANGYLRICTDPEESFIVGIVNAADIIMQFNEIAGKAQGFKANSKEFAQTLTTNVLADRMYAQYLKDGSKFPKKLMQNISKETVTTSVSLSNFTETLAQNLATVNVTEIIISTGTGVGVSISEEVFMDLSGWIGDALEMLFVFGKTENVMIQHSDYTKARGNGSIYIQNQGGGIRASQQIKVEAETELDIETSLNVFTVTLDSAIINAMKETNLELYEALMNGKTYTYNISLLKDGQETQPDGKVTVYIPIPEDMHLLAYSGQVKIYRSEKNGTMTPMDVSIQDGCFVFTTDHFSLYTLVGYDAEGDVFDQTDEPTKSPTMWVVVAVSVVLAAGVSAAVAILLFRKKKSA